MYKLVMRKKGKRVVKGTDKQERKEWACFTLKL